MRREKFLSDEFNFENTKLHGILDTYEFDGYLGTGSMGLIVKYSSKDSHVIFKHYRQSDDEFYTQASESQYDDPKFRSYQNERDWLLPISFLSRFNSFIEHATENGALSIHDNFQIELNNESISLNDLFDIVSMINDGSLVKGSIHSPAPLVVDYAKYILDSDGNYFIPASKPSNFYSENSYLLTFPINYLDRDIPLYSFEDGLTLDKVICQDLTTEKKDLIAKNLIQSVYALNNFGIVHRDLKPENIIVKSDLTVKILDYGTATRFSPSDSFFDLFEPKENIVPVSFVKNSIGIKFGGARFFSAPETFRDQPKYRYSGINKLDIFSAGLLASVLITNQHPYLNKEMSNFLQFNNSLEQKRNYAQEIRSIRSRSRKYKNFQKKILNEIKKTNSSILPKITSMYDLIKEHRPDNFSEIIPKLGIKKLRNHPFLTEFDINPRHPQYEQIKKAVFRNHLYRLSKLPYYSRIPVSDTKGFLKDCKISDFI